MSYYCFISTCSPVAGTKAIHSLLQVKGLRIMWGCALLLMLAAVLSGCVVAQGTPYSEGYDYSLPQTTVSPGDIHALDGNLIW